MEQCGAKEIVQWVVYRPEITTLHGQSKLVFRRKREEEELARRRERVKRISQKKA